MNEKRIRMIVDMAMTVLLPLLMAYSLIGERFHEIIGSVMLLLVITHQILNRRWYAALFKGRYTVRRIVQTGLDVVLLVVMVMQPISGMLMSKHLYTFIHIEGVSAVAREIHMCLAYWSFVLMCVHAGTHLPVPLNRLRRNKKSLWTGIHFAWILAAAYGCVAFVRRNLADYMFRRTAFAFFDYAEPKAYFFADYVAMMLLFMLVGYALMVGMTRASRASTFNGR